MLLMRHKEISCVALCLAIQIFFLKVLIILYTAAIMLMHNHNVISDTCTLHGKTHSRLLLINCIFISFSMAHRTAAHNCVRVYGILFSIYIKEELSEEKECLDQQGLTLLSHLRDLPSKS